jgi:hypothetical protein
MIAADMPPRHVDLANQPFITGIKRQVVEHDVAGGHTEGGFGADNVCQRYVANEIELGSALGLRVGEQDHIEGARLV